MQSVLLCARTLCTSNYKLSDVPEDGAAGRNILQCDEMCLSELSAHFVLPISIHFRFCTVITWWPGPVTLSLVVYYADLVNPNMWIAMRINPTSAYYIMLIYYNVIVVNILHVSATFRGRLQGGVIRRIYYKDFKTLYQYNVLNF